VSAAPEAQITQWEPGEVVGQYSLLGRIAVGGMAEIWLARQTGLAGFKRVVVIKKISDAFSQDPKFVEMFLDEARIAAQLSHPNIVQIYDLGEYHGSYYIVMEYLHGEDLGTVVRTSVRAHSPLAISQAVRIVASAADGLAYAHDRVGLDGKPLNIVHRDVSPHNVIVTYDGGVKLVDFGIAKARSRVSQTMDGTIKGKVNYLSPEQARGDPLDFRSDVFSLGIILYEAIGRCRLFNYDDVYMNLLAITGEGAIPPPSTLNKDIPPELDAVVGKALSRALETRYQSARALQLALESWLRKSSDAPGTFEIASTLRGLFAERIAKRTKLIESAQRGDTAPHQFAQELQESQSPEPAPPEPPQTATAPAAEGPLRPVHTAEVAVVRTVMLDPTKRSPPSNLGTPVPAIADPEEAKATSLGVPMATPPAATPVDPQLAVMTSLGVPAAEAPIQLRTRDPEENLKTSLGAPAVEPSIGQLQTRIAVPANSAPLRPAQRMGVRMETARVAVVSKHVSARSRARLWVVGTIALMALVGIATFLWLRAS
jgi:serine/threonine protein kinase